MTDHFLSCNISEKEKEDNESICATYSFIRGKIYLRYSESKIL